MAIVQKGDKAPAFKSKDQFGNEVDSEKIEGKILLSFHPLAFTSLCTDQMRDLENKYSEFEEKGIRPVGFSVDAGPSKAVWSQSIGLSNLQILADQNPYGEIAKACGVFNEDMNTSGRANVLVENGQVIWSKEYDLGERPDLDEILDQF